MGLKPQRRALSSYRSRTRFVLPVAALLALLVAGNDIDSDSGASTFTATIAIGGDLLLSRSRKDGALLSDEDQKFGSCFHTLKSYPVDSSNGALGPDVTALLRNSDVVLANLETAVSNRVDDEVRVKIRDPTAAERKPGNAGKKKGGFIVHPAVVQRLFGPLIEARREAHGAYAYVCGGLQLTY